MISNKTEKYATISIQDLEKNVETELLPSAFRICQRISLKGKKELKLKIKEYIKKECPIHRCAILEGDISGCPNHLCWIAEGPTWFEFLIPEISETYTLLMYTYIESLNIPDDPDEDVTVKESMLDVMDRKTQTGEAQIPVINLFRTSKVICSRTSIVEAILQAHKDRNFTLSVPCLIIQIEGMMHDLAYDLKWKFDKKEMYNNESAKVWALIKRLGDKPLEKTLLGFYTRRDDDSDAPRNLILHGRNLDYGRNSKLSTVLILVMIYIAVLTLILTKGSTTYLRTPFGN